jgi:L-iditol 2-dehydrogenase
MKQAVMIGPGTVKIHDVEKPVLRTGEALVKIKRVGICGSDVHVSHGALPFVQYPIVQGHEACGDVVETYECKNIRVGDKAVIIPTSICGACNACTSGRTNLCEKLQIIGVHINGLCSEYVSVPEQIIVRIPQHISYDIGAMIEPLAVAVHAIRQAEEVKDKSVLVMGAGMIGNLAAQVAKARGAKVMIVGRTQYRLDFAKQFGLDYCINENSEDVSAAVSNAFGQGSDICIECIGVAKSVNDCFAYSKKGGRVVIVGIFGEKQLIDVFSLQDKELVVRGAMMYVRQDFEESVALIEQGQLNLEPLISAHFGLEEFDGAYQYISDKNNPVMKVMIDIGQ